MSTRSRAREVWVGLVVIVAVAGLLGLVTMASDGPGFLAPQRTHRRGLSRRPGHSHRQSRCAWPVSTPATWLTVDLVEVEGSLRARVRISLPASLVKKLRQDVKISIQPSLTGMSHVNILSTGRSTVALVPGQSIPGVETSFFDPIIEQVGLGPVERNHLSHTIAEVRQTVDSIGPRAAPDARLAPGDHHQPARDERLDPARRRIDGQPRRRPRPKTQRQLAPDREDHGSGRRGNWRSARSCLPTIARTSTRPWPRRATSSPPVNDIIDKDRPKVERMLDGLDGTRARADRVLYQADQIASQVSLMLARNQAEIERSVTNIRDATDWANKLVQKIFTNPFVLSPFYKPSHEDLRCRRPFTTRRRFS